MFFRFQLIRLYQREASIFIFSFLFVFIHLLFFLFTALRRGIRVVEGFSLGAATPPSSTTTTMPMHKRVTEFRRNMIDRAKLGQRPPTPYLRSCSRLSTITFFPIFLFNFMIKKKKIERNEVRIEERIICCNFFSKERKNGEKDEKMKWGICLFFFHSILLFYSLLFFLNINWIIVVESVDVMNREKKISYKFFFSFLFERLHQSDRNYVMFLLSFSLSLFSFSLLDPSKRLERYVRTYLTMHL